MKISENETVCFFVEHDRKVLNMSENLVVAKDMVVGLAYTLYVENAVEDSAPAADPLEYLHGHGNAAWSPKAFRSKKAVWSRCRTMKATISTAISLNGPTTT